MRPTLRGYGVALVVGFALVMALEYGPRSLGAIVVPLVVVSLVAVGTVYRTSAPGVNRKPIEPGFVGDKRRVRVTVDDPESAVDSVSDSLESAPSSALTVRREPTVDRTGSGIDLEYGIRLEKRGEHEIGPLSVTATDVFGLVRRRFVDHRTSSVLVYPRVYDLSSESPALRELETAAGIDAEESFDYLREYARGDSLRDVHWKSTAKRADGTLAVAETSPEGTTDTVAIVGECEPGYDDRMATALATLSTYVLEREVGVTLAVPNDRGSAAGVGDRRELLALLAVAGSGELEAQTRAEADVYVRADADETTVSFEDRTVPFERLRTEAEPTAVVG